MRALFLKEIGPFVVPSSVGALLFAGMYALAFDVESALDGARRALRPAGLPALPRPGAAVAANGTGHRRGAPTVARERAVSG